MSWETGNENAVEQQREEYHVFVSSCKGSFNGISELFNFFYSLFFVMVGTILLGFC